MSSLEEPLKPGESRSVPGQCIEVTCTEELQLVGLG